MVYLKQFYYYINANYDYKPHNKKILFIIYYINVLYNYNK